MLKADRSVTYLQCLYPHDRLLEKVAEMREMFPDEVLQHLEFIRFNGRVILAYCAWDGRELVVLQPPGQAGFARLKARRQSDLEQHIVGQVVTLNWWEPSDTKR